MAYRIISTENVYVGGQLDAAQSTIDVPGPCTSILCCHGGYPTQNAILNYFTIDQGGGDSGDASHVGAIEVWQYICAAQALLHDPPTGEQSIRYTLDPNSGGNTDCTLNNLEFIYLEGLDRTQISGFDVKQSASSSGTDHSPTTDIHVETGKYAFCVSCSWGGSYNSVDQVEVVIRNLSGDGSDISVDTYTGDHSTVEMGGVYSSSSQWAAVSAEYTADTGEEGPVGDYTVDPTGVIASTSFSATESLESLTPSVEFVDADADFSGAFSTDASTFTPQAMAAGSGYLANESLATLQALTQSSTAATVLSATDTLSSLLAQAGSAAASAVFSAAESLAVFNTTGTATAAAVCQAIEGLSAINVTGQAVAVTVFSSAFKEGYAVSAAQIEASSVLTAAWVGSGQTESPAGLAAAALLSASHTGISEFTPLAYSASTTFSAQWLGADQTQTPAALAAAAVLSGEFLGAAQTVSGSAAAAAVLSASFVEGVFQVDPTTAAANLGCIWVENGLYQVPAAAVAGADFLAVFTGVSRWSAQALVSGAVFSATSTLGTQQETGVIQAAIVMSATSSQASQSESPTALIAGGDFSALFSGQTTSQTPSALVAAGVVSATPSLGALTPSVSVLLASAVIPAPSALGALLETPTVLVAGGVLLATESLATLLTSPNALVAATTVTGSFEEGIYAVDPISARTVLSAAKQLETLQALAQSAAAAAVLSASTSGVFTQTPTTTSAACIFSAQWAGQSTQETGSLVTGTVISANTPLVVYFTPGALVAGTTLTVAALLQTLSISPTATSASALFSASFLSEFEFPVQPMAAAAVLSAAWSSMAITGSPTTLMANTSLSATWALQTLTVSPSSVVAAAVFSAVFQPGALFSTFPLVAATSSSSSVSLISLVLSPFSTQARTKFDLLAYLPQPPPLLDYRRHRASSPHILQRLHPKLPESTAEGEAIDLVTHRGTRTVFNWSLANYSERSKVLAILGYGDCILGVDDALDGGGIYKTDTILGTSTYLAPLHADLSGTQYGPNGCAMGDDDWFYYATYTPIRQLYRTNMVTHDIEKFEATGVNYYTCGAWYNGKYYYTPTRSWDLVEVTFTGNTWTESVVYSGEDGFWAAGLFFGDIAITKSGMLYGNGEYVGTSPKVFCFYSLDMNDITGGYTLIRDYEKTAENDKYQLHLVGDTSQDGGWDMYGISTAATRGIYRIDITNGQETLLSTMPGVYPTDVSINDGAALPPDASWGEYPLAMEDFGSLPVDVKTAIKKYIGHRPPRLPEGEDELPDPVRAKSPTKISPVDPPTHGVTEQRTAKLPERRERR